MNDLNIQKIEVEKNNGLKKCYTDLELLEGKINELEITDENTYGISTELLKQIKNKIKDFDDLRKSIVKPFNEIVKTWNDEFNPIIERAKLIKYPLERKITNYQLMLEEKRKEEAEKEKQRKLQEIEDEKNRIAALDQLNDTKVLEKYEDKFEEVKQNIENKPLEIQKGFKTGNVKTFLKSNWKYRIINPDLIPREYLEPSDSLLKAAAKNENIRNKGIAGIEFWDDKNIMQR